VIILMFVCSATATGLSLAFYLLQLTALSADPPDISQETIVLQLTVNALLRVNVSCPNCDWHGCSFIVVFYERRCCHLESLGDLDLELEGSVSSGLCFTL
jgi:hypothetical protein